MTDDPHKVLGVARNASQVRIRTKYLQLVRQLHPDTNPDPAAHERLKLVTVAYRAVYDPDKAHAESNKRARTTKPRTKTRVEPGTGFSFIPYADAVADAAATPKRKRTLDYDDPPAFIPFDAAQDKKNRANAQRARTQRDTMDRQAAERQRLFDDERRRRRSG